MTIRLIEFPTLLTVLMDTGAWFVIHMGVSTFVTRLPDRYFARNGSLFRLFSWETKMFYEMRLNIKEWKDRLPDAAPWFGGMPKRSINGQTISDFQIFINETRRGEAAHWISIFFAPLFFLWNPVWVGYFMLLFAVAINLPCILVQRYNRCRLTHLVEKWGLHERSQ